MKNKEMAIGFAIGILGTLAVNFLVPFGFIVNAPAINIYKRVSDEEQRQQEIWNKYKR